MSSRDDYRRVGVGFLAILATGPLVLGADAAAGREQVAVAIETDYVKYVLGTDGRGLSFIDKKTGKDYCRRDPSVPVARVTIDGKEHGATSAAADGDSITLGFGETGARAVLKVVRRQRYLILEVASLEGRGISALAFVDIRLTLKGVPGEPLAACAMALNLQTNVPRMPEPTDQLQAICYQRFGLAGASVAIVACPFDQMRAIMQEVVTAAPELPHSPLGGPWAMDNEINKGSYLFDFGDLNEKTVDDWIKLARQLGINQIDFHGGRSFRFGDCRPNPEIFPNGVASMKAVVDRLHEAGIKAGLHTYAFFIAKDAPWVTPVPDPRLGKDAVYTLASDVAADSAAVPVVESLADRKLDTGFFVRDSLTVQIDNELIVYAGLSKEAPYAFTKCQRGAHGTKAAAHTAGAKVQHLKQCFFLFTPDGDSTLLEEVAQKTADLYNAVGFDMMYLDALDGEGILGGDDCGWYYGSKFVFEIFKRLKKPPVMEMSTFHHHLWYVRSRMGAWDHPNRSYKRFIDIHCEANAGLARMFLPGHLGWWAVKTYSDFQNEPTYAEDIEYLCGKCIARDCGFSVMGVNPGNIDTIPVYGRLAKVMQQYEALRHSSAVDATTKARLAEPGKEFTLFQGPAGRWRFRPVVYAKHKVENLSDWSRTWRMANPFGRQPVRLRIEALPSVSPYDTPGGVSVEDFTDAAGFSDKAANAGVTIELRSSAEQVKAGKTSGALTASSTGKVARTAAWARVSKEFKPPLNLEKHEGLGVWVYGDGKGELLNVQLTSPSHVSGGIGDHYVPIDFVGWRYVELVEPEGERWTHYAWPYGGTYSIFRENVDFRQVQTVSLWYNNLPADGSVTCYLSPIRGLSVFASKMKNPAVTIGGKTMVFPVEMETGSYLEFNSPADCKLYNKDGGQIGDVKLQGDVPPLDAGANQISFKCEPTGEVHPRARVTVICQGDPL
jgi:hypothetical protein